MDRRTRVGNRGLEASREKAPTTRADFEAAEWIRQGDFNWYCTFTFDQRTHRLMALHKPKALHDFVEREIRAAGYRGPFAIVAHDNHGTRYYHAHVLLSDYKPGMCASLSQHFRKFGNVSKEDDGPIRGNEAFYYCANRAYGREHDEDMVRTSFAWQRTPRKRGRGRGRGRSKAARTEATVQLQEMTA